MEPPQPGVCKKDKGLQAPAPSPHHRQSISRGLHPPPFDALPNAHAYTPTPEAPLSPRCLICQGPRSSASQAPVVQLFGAQQVFPVRSPVAKRRVQAALSAQLALVLTIAEAKGLEFETVFLVDFFRESEFARWPLVLPEALLDPPDAPLSPAGEALVLRLAQVKPSSGRGFDPQVDYMLCRELKQLYTAVTRAWLLLLVYEEDSAASLPVLAMWWRHGLLSVCFNASPAAREAYLGLLANITPEQWRRQGVRFMTQGRHDLAVRCSECAGDTGLRREVEALRSFAAAGSLQKRTRLANPTAQRAMGAAYDAAGDGFAALDMWDMVAAAYIGAAQWGEASPVLERLGDWERLVSVLVQAEAWAPALEFCLTYDLHDRLLCLVREQARAPAASAFLVRQFVTGGFPAALRCRVLQWVLGTRQKALLHRVCARPSLGRGRRRGCGRAPGPCCGGWGSLARRRPSSRGRGCGAQRGDCHREAQHRHAWRAYVKAGALERGATTVAVHDGTRKEPLLTAAQDLEVASAAFVRFVASEGEWLLHRATALEKAGESSERAADVREGAGGVDGDSPADLRTAHCEGSLECLEKLRDVSPDSEHDEARARLFEITGHYARAAECLMRLGAYPKAAGLWETAGRFTEAVAALEKCGAFARAEAVWEKAEDGGRAPRCHGRACGYDAVALCWGRAGKGPGAAEAFDRARDFANAKTHWLHAAAAEIAPSPARRHFFRRAARCSETEGDFAAAATHSENVEDREAATSCYERCARFAEALLLWKRHGTRARGAAAARRYEGPTTFKYASDLYGLLGQPLAKADVLVEYGWRDDGARLYLQVYAAAAAAVAAVVAALGVAGAHPAVL